MWTTIHIAPGVYWIDNPDDPAVRRPEAGETTPFGMKVRLSKTRIVGTGDAPKLVIAWSKKPAPKKRCLMEDCTLNGQPLSVPMPPDVPMVVSQHRIRAAGCILPVSHNLDIPKELGLRHRAALGMSQESDALCVIVSEENGAISIARAGQL